MYIGIDLGTTNSSLAVFDGEAVSVVPNAAGENLTPSVVRLDPRGNVIVGRRARAALENDPASARREWKRLMGTAELLSFGAPPGRTLSPVELSGHVITSLLGDARDALGFTPRAAVISTPALFEVPQNHATVEAGKRAGLEEVVLIQEPVASAIAAGWRGDGAGTWMVFDLGGGTLDVSLLETRDGRLRVVDHAGDNFLGGKDIDQALLDLVLRQARAPLGSGHSLRVSGAPERTSQPRARRALERLQVACEQAKIELSRAREAVVLVNAAEISGAAANDDGAAPTEVVVTRADLERVMAPFMDRSLALVQAVLDKNHRSADEVARVVLVGGPTLTPLVRTRLGQMFGRRLAEGIDPMTIVVRGAALFAGTAGLDARPRAAASPARRGLAIRIEHPAVTADLEPFVVGRFLPTPGEALPARVRIERADGGFVSPPAAPSPEGSFVVQVKLERGKQNHFRLLAEDQTRAPVALGTERFAIVHGLSVSDPPLGRSVGVACADDLVQVYFPKGTPLPARKMFVHRTAQPVAARDARDALCVPVVQGESTRAHRDRLIGLLRVRGVRDDLPAGSRIEVTLQLDRSGQLHARADIPALGQTFEEIVHLLVPTANLETVAREIEAAGRRADGVQRRAFEAGAPAAVTALSGVAGLLAEAERSLPEAETGDADALQKVHRLLLDANTALDDAEAVLEWPDLQTESRRTALYYTPLVAAWGTAAEQQLYDQVLQAATAAEKARNAPELERQLEAMRAIGRASYCRNPRALESELDWVAAHVADAGDVARANHLVERARVARNEGNQVTLRALVAEIWTLFPAPPELQQKSFGSGVR